ncbi:DUF5960 family protein [Aerococcaceae bacterium WGS1372]
MKENTIQLAHLSQNILDLEKEFSKFYNGTQLFFALTDDIEKTMHHGKVNFLR